jgi:hypothetical protein
MKNLLNLKGAHTLSKNEQQTISGGGATQCISYNRCQNASDCLSFTPNCSFECYVVVGADDGVCMAIIP